MDPLRPSLQRPSPLVALALLASGAVAQSVQLSGPLAHPSSDVLSFALDPSGSRAVYVADQDTLGVFELYSVPLDRSTPPVELSGAMPTTGGVVGSGGGPAFLIAPQGRVVFRADPAVDERFMLFSAPIDGSRPPVQLSTLEAYEFQLTPDGARVVYRTSWGFNELQVVPMDRSGATQGLSGTDFVYKDEEWSIDPTSTRVLFAKELYNSPYRHPQNSIRERRSSAGGPRDAPGQA